MLMDQARDAFKEGVVIAQDWLLSPAAWSQFALLIGAYLLARLVNRLLAPRVTKWLTPETDSQTTLAKARRFVLIFLPLLLPLLAYGFTAIGEAVTRSLFGSGAVIAFGKRVFLFLAARAGQGYHSRSVPADAGALCAGAGRGALCAWRPWSCHHRP
jgi:cytochrome b561